MEAVGTLAAGAALVLAFGVGSWFPGRYVLAPLRRLPQSAGGPWQFGLLDYCALFVLFQYTLATAGAAWRWNSTIGQVVTFYLVIATVVLWLVAIRALSRARIADGHRRFVFLVVVVPLVAVMSVGAPLGIMMLMRAVSNDWPWLSWPVALTFSMPVAVWLCRRIMDWIVRTPEAMSAEPIGTDIAEATTMKE